MKASLGPLVTAALATLLAVVGTSGAGTPMANERAGGIGGTGKNSGGKTLDEFFLPP